MSNFEEPTFDLAELPDASSLKREAAHDLRLVEEGASPDQVALLREALAKSKIMGAAIYEEIIKPYLEQYGVNDEEELPPVAQIEIFDKKARWFREWRGGVYNDDGEIVDE